MIARYNQKSLMFGVPGLVLQVVGNVLANPQMGANQPIVGGLCLLAGTALLVVGFAYYAMAKGRSPLWCLAGFLSCCGLIILALLKDQAPDGVPRRPM
jgi:hypothetical protein